MNDSCHDCAGTCRGSCVGTSQGIRDSGEKERICSGAIKPNRRRKTLILTLTEECNLACRYCYESNKSTRKMPLSVAQDAIVKHFRESESFDEIEISFHGGEPLLEFDTLRSICEWLWERQWEKPYICFATTNGTLAHGDIQVWAASHRANFYLGLSLDGTPTMHNLNRSNSYEQIDISFFQRTWPDQPVKMTISNATLPYLAEGVRHLHESGILFHCNFAHGPDWMKEETVSTLTTQLQKLIVYYLAHPEITPCEFMMMKLEIIGARCRRAEEQGKLFEDDGFSKWCGIGTDMVAVDVDGREYPCQSLLPNTMGRMADQYRRYNFADTSKLHDERCKGCVLLPLCPTCYGSNIVANGHPSLRDKGICTLSKIRALASSSLQAQMLVRREEFSTFRALEPRALVDIIRGIEAVQSGVSVNLGAR
jgi:uncharacterized protein